MKRLCAFDGAPKCLFGFVFVAFIALSLVPFVSGISPPPPGGLIPLAGTPSWLIGVNYPWASYSGNSNYGRDFGKNNWGYQGFASKMNANRAKFAKLKDAGARIARVWIFADGRAGIIVNSDNTPTKMDQYVFQDFEALITIAKEYGIHLVPVLFDFHLAFKPQWNNNVQLGGNNVWIYENKQKNALLNNVVRPLLARFGNEPIIHAWEVMNEPEWIIWDLPQGTFDSSKVAGVSLEAFYSWASSICKIVHEETNAYCTLGSASLKWYKVWTPQFAQSRGYPPLNLDYYQAHYYSWMDGYSFDKNEPLGPVTFSPLEQSYTALGLDRPMVIGEFYSDRMPFQNQLSTFKNKGYAGAWPWSVNADHAIPWDKFTSWTKANRDYYHPAESQSDIIKYNDHSHDGLNSGAIAGIVIGSIIGVVLLVAIATIAVVGLVFAWRYKRNAHTARAVSEKMPYVLMEDGQQEDGTL